ncbi:hypothetical protein [Streptomyces atratus]|uniref:hypothetical protein n=1 Tax=Streptomyces atratus TaxID=1893 RepID=UPI0037BC3DE2
MEMVAGVWWRSRPTVATRLVLPPGYEWEARPAAAGAALPGGDELRIRALLVRLGVRL